MDACVEDRIDLTQSVTIMIKSKQFTKKNGAKIVC